MTEITATQLAERLGVTSRRARELLRSGVIAGHQLANGTWLAEGAAVTQYETSRRRGSGRTLASATAWGLLWELSGLDAYWLSESTRSRVRRRVRNDDAAALAGAVAARTRAHRYRSANAERAAVGLIHTGRAAASALEGALMEDARAVAGYVRSGTPDEYAKRHFMLADPAGRDVIYENSLPVVYAAETMPAAVIAADLAVSTDTRERSAGLAALEALRQRWLAGR